MVDPAAVTTALSQCLDAAEPWANTVAEPHAVTTARSNAWTTAIPHAQQCASPRRWTLALRSALTRDTVERAHAGPSTGP